MSRRIEALEAVNEHAARLETRLATMEAGGAAAADRATHDVDPPSDARTETAQEIVSKRETAAKSRKANASRGRKGGNVSLEVSE